MKLVRAHVVVSGIVQGVFFRAHTQQEARRLGLTGWVRNIPSGQVEAVFEGDQEKVEEMIRWCHHGPPSARVTRVEVNWEKPTGEFTGFRIKY